MSILVVLATVAAVVGALGLVLTSAASRQQSRHRGGAAVLPRLAASTLALGAGAFVLVFFTDQVELALAAIGLWWASLPWLALTSRLASWAHAAWAHAANAAACGLVYLAWQATTHERPVLAAVGVWALWGVAASAAVLLLGFLREAATVTDRAHRLSPRPALSVVCALGSVAAVALALMAPPGQARPPAQAASPAVTTPTVTRDLPAASPPSTRPSTTRTASPAPSTTSPAPRAATSSPAARSARRTATLPPATSPTPTPTTTSSTSSTTTSSPTSSTVEIKVLPTPTNRPHTPPGHG